MRNRKTEKGLTLVEVVIALGLSVVVFSASIWAAMAVRQTRYMTRHHIQAMNVARSEVERLKGIPFASIGNEDGDNDNVDAGPATYDAGPDGQFGTGDDLDGTLTVAVRDFLDMDGDDDTDEIWIDIDNNGVNDQVAKPVRVTFEWTEHMIGPDQDFAVTIDTLIGS